MSEPVSSNFPASLDTDTTLFGDAVNLKSLTLDAPLSAIATSVSVTESITGINTPCYLLIETELLYAENKAAGDFNPVTRGAGGTSAASHSAGIIVYVVYAANYHNQVKRALLAIETELGVAPKTIDDTVAPDASPASVAAYLDMVAARIKNISGAGTWYTTSNRFLALTAAGNIDFPTSSELTIAGGGVVPTQNWHTIDTEADAASDDLDNLMVNNVSDGFLLILRPNSDSRTVIIKHNTGNILCGHAEDIILDDQRDMAILIYDATLSKWLAVSNATRPDALLLPPAGFLLNGQISVSVASNNLTVALVTKAGTAATTVNPIYAYIGGGWRKITAALSVTLTAGTNWFNAGGAELATKEIDFPVYLRYNATDGVCIGPARIYHGRIYSDFSTTNTNEKYAAWNTITNATANDECQVIGRFAATLSAGAGYTWTVPTFTATNLIQRPIYESRWLEWTSVLTGFSADPTNTAYHYQIVGRKIDVLFSQVTEGTSNATTFTATMPMTPATVTNAFWVFMGSGFDNGVLLTTPSRILIGSGTLAVTIRKDAANGLWTASGGKRVIFTAWYEI